MNKKICISLQEQNIHLHTIIMRTRHLLPLLSFLFLCRWAQAQQMRPANPVLRERLEKYAADNHLPRGRSYIYWDSLTKKPYRFNPTDFVAEDISQPRVALPVVYPLPVTGNALEGGNFHLLKDINNFTDANPSNDNFLNIQNQQHFAVMNNVAYFATKDDSNGEELWRSDGTAAGTYLVKDINPGESSSGIGNIILSGNEIFFSADSSSNYTGSKIWKSDGTDAGTMQVSDAVNAIQYPLQLCDVNGTVFFTTTNNDRRNNQLWKTDGTTQGTVLVKDLSNENNFDVISTLVSAQKMVQSGSEIILNTSSLESGVYLVKIKLDGKVVQQKFIKE